MPADPFEAAAPTDLNGPVMSLGRAIAWVAYRDGIGPFRNLPGDKVRSERWGGLHPENYRPDRRHHLLWDIRWVLARVRWRLRQRPGPHRVPLPPLGLGRRYRLRGIARHNGVKSVAALLPLLWQDVRACNAEWAEHDRRMDAAERELRQAVAGGQFTTEGRAGFREPNVVAPMVAMPLTVWRDPVMRLTKDDRLGPDADLRGDKRALLRFHDVQLLTAEVLAKWPKQAPVDSSDAAMSKVPVHDVVEDVAGWMRRYAEGLRANGQVAKREDAISAARAALSCTVRQAAEAFKALPYPELRNPPRTGFP